MRLTLVVLAMLSVGCDSDGEAPPLSAADSLAVADSLRVLVAAVDAAANARDLSRFLPMFDSSASFRMLQQGEVMTFGDFAAPYRRNWSTPRPDAWVRQDTADIAVLGPDVVLTVWQGVVGAVSRSGTSDSSRYLVSALWRRYPDGWRIVHGHESWPEQQ